MASSTRGDPLLIRVISLQHALLSPCPSSSNPRAPQSTARPANHSQPKTVTYPSEATFRVTSTGSRLIPVLVGGNTLTFTPNSVTANPGDVIQFQFAARNHTVTQSTQTSPCQPLGGNSSSAAGGAQLGIHSGFIPFDGGSAGVVGTFDVPVLDTKPMFLYCAQANHCQSGMVMVVNA